MSAISNLKPPKDIRMEIAERFREVRLDQNITQEALAKRTGVSLGSLRRFESEGEISLKNLVKLAIGLNRAQDFDDVFKLGSRIDLFDLPAKTRKRASR